MHNDQVQEQQWHNLQVGHNCPLCAPRQPNNDYRLEIAALSSSTLYLFPDQRFRGYCLLIYDRRHASRLEALNQDEYIEFMQDVRRAVQAISAALQPDHMNYECLGNSSPHLHWHLVPRYGKDPRWGQPIWEGWQRNEFTINRVTLREYEYADFIQRIGAALKATGD
jgi:diadenosine tetraphosphate (Ap4A) HIT family hydrolase